MPSSLSFGRGALLLLGASLATSGTPPGFPPSLRRKGCLKEDGQPNLFCPGDDGYGCFKIPTLLRTKNGTLLAMIEAILISAYEDPLMMERLGVHPFLSMATVL